MRRVVIWCLLSSFFAALAGCGGDSVPTVTRPAPKRAKMIEDEAK